MVKEIAASAVAGALTALGLVTGIVLFTNWWINVVAYTAERFGDND